MGTLKSPDEMLEIVNAMISTAKKFAPHDDLYEILDIVLFWLQHLGLSLAIRVLTEKNLLERWAM